MLNPRNLPKQRTEHYCNDLSINLLSSYTHSNTRIQAIDYIAGSSAALVYFISFKQLKNINQQVVMTETNLYWESKIKFFSKFLGYDNVEELEDTLDETNKSQLNRKKGIKVVQNGPVIQSMMLSRIYDQEIDKKWLNVIRMPFRSTSREQLLRLTSQGTCYPHKVMPWLAQNRYKINLKLYSMKKNQYRTSLNPNNPYRLQKSSPQLQYLVKRQGHSKIAQLLGIFMLLREDILFTQTLLKIGFTVDQYLYDAPVMAFSLLYHFCCLGAFLPFLTGDGEAINSIINSICHEININCSASSFFVRDKISLHHYIRVMIEDFWLNISQPKSPFREKILYFLIINQMSLKAISRVCEATIVGLSRIFHQGNREKSIEVLNNPAIFMDKQLFLSYLFQPIK